MRAYIGFAGPPSVEQGRSSAEEEPPEASRGRDLAGEARGSHNSTRSIVLGPMGSFATYESARARLLSIAYRMLGSASDAEDVVQEAWFRWREAD